MPSFQWCDGCKLNYMLSHKVLDTEQERLIAELEQGNGTYYITQERAMAPGIAGHWPDVIPHPKTKNGRLVKRTWPKEERHD